MFEVDNVTYYTAHDVAEMFEVKVETLWSWRKKGLLTGCKMPNGKYVYSEAEIAAFIKGREEK